MYTPWGVSQYSKKITSGIVFYETAGHGGFHVSVKKNLLIPEYMRSNDGWYEEDSDWAIVAVVFPEFFPEDQKVAKESLMNWNPDSFEKFFGESVLPGQSIVRDEKIFYEQHKNDLVVISAVSVGDGLVRCTATLGGLRDPELERHEFLVAADEYMNRDRNGFIIDVSRYQALSS